MKKDRIITFDNGTQKQLQWIEEPEGYRKFDEKEMRKRIKGYGDLNEKARKKQMTSYLEDSKTIVEAKAPIVMANTHRKQKFANSHNRHPNEKDFAIGISAVLAICQLFKNPVVGFFLLSCILCGLRCEALREFEPDFRPYVSIPIQDPKLIEIFIDIVNAVVTRSKWKGKNCEIKRVAILDYRNTNLTIGRHIQDFSYAKIKVKKGVHITTPMSYIDTVVLIIGASSAQLKEAAPYLENACVFLLGCGTIDWNAEKLSADCVSAYNPKVLDLLTQNREQIAAALRLWWAAEDEANWAQRVVAKAKASFGKPDSNYIDVKFNPSKLRKQIQYNVLLSYFDEVERLGWISTEDLEQYRQGAKAVFDPDPIVETPPRRIEEPDVFLELMGLAMSEHHDKILQEHEPFVKANKPLAAYRTISNERYLVILESDFKKVYPKTARKATGVDISFLQKPNWERDLQKILSEAGIIKAASAGYRYRYDLFQNGSRDSTYVIAISCEYLENSSAKA